MPGAPPLAWGRGSDPRDTLHLTHVGEAQLTSGPRPARRYPLTKQVEYKVETGRPTEIEVKLNDLVNDGWEFVQAVPATGGSDPRLLVLLRREGMKPAAREPTGW